MHIEILDVTGRRVRVLTNGESDAAYWDLRDQRGARVPRGLYFARLTRGARAVVKRVVVAR
jgi:hypothetical protein